jgi:pilus assembly protein FimV
LQVIQFMYDRPNPYYFQCADLVIGTGGEAPDAGAGGSANAGQGGASLGGTGGVPASGAGGTGNLGAGGAPPVGAAGAPSAAGAPASVGGSSATPATGAAGVGAPIVAGDDSDDEDSGCSVAPGTSASLLGVGSLVLFALSAMRRRSRRR